MATFRNNGKMLVFQKYYIIIVLCSAPTSSTCNDCMQQLTITANKFRLLYCSSHRQGKLKFNTFCDVYPDNDCSAAVETCWQLLVTVACSHFMWNWLEQKNIIQ